MAFGFFCVLGKVFELGFPQRLRVSAVRKIFSEGWNRVGRPDAGPGGGGTGARRRPKTPDPLSGEVLQPRQTYYLSTSVPGIGFSLICL